MCPISPPTAASTLRSRREILRDLTQDAIEAGSYGEPTASPAAAGSSTDGWTARAGCPEAAWMDRPSRPAAAVGPDPCPAGCWATASNVGRRWRQTGTAGPLRRRPCCALSKSTRSSQGTGLRRPPVVCCPSRSRPRQFRNRKSVTGPCPGPFLGAGTFVRRAAQHGLNVACCRGVTWPGQFWVCGRDSLLK